MTGGRVEPQSNPISPLQCDSHKNTCSITKQILCSKDGYGRSQCNTDKETLLGELPLNQF